MPMRTISIDQVLPGTLLGDNVNDAGGRILLRAGTLLTESVIESLRRREVVALPIDVQDVDDAMHQEAFRAQAERRLLEAFRNSGGGQASRALRQATLEFMLEHRR